MQTVSAAWNWLGTNAAQVEALTALVVAALSALIWLVYRRQARIMHAQKDLSGRQTALQSAQRKTEELLAVYSLAPVIVPDKFDAGDLKWVADEVERKVEISNIGRGCAFDIRVTGWDLSSDGVRSQDTSWLTGTRFLGPGGQTRLARRRPNGAGVPAVLLVHYRDFTDLAWHTTWNLSAGSGDYEQSSCPYVWSPRNWAECPRAQCFCPHCKGG